MSGEPDILVIGSENGLGKTSILECCSLLLLGITIDTKENWFPLHHFFPTLKISDLLLKSGSDGMEIIGDMLIDKVAATVRIWINLSGNMKIENTLGHTPEYEEIPEVNLKANAAHDLLKAIFGLTPNPVINDAFLLFHSYRKVQEGNVKIGAMIEMDRTGSPLSAFKLQILYSLMGMSGLFEFEENQKQDGVIEKLNELVQTYAGGTISKLRPSKDNTVDFRVTPANGGESFTFDGLSSGQKEIISTLFLIWHHTRSNPSVVLIDEPELHLNAQWHRRFVKSLTSLAPQNQYIMATHSEDIMDSVDRDRRILLRNKPEGSK
jgi:hypothetical protein